MSNTNNKDNPNLAINPNPADLEPRKSINAPEVDQSIFGLQVYDLPEGLQVSTENGPEAAANVNSLITHPDDANPKERVLTSKIHEQRADHRQLRYSFGILMVILTISLGIGLGVGLPASRSSSPSTTSTTSGPSPLIHGVLNDTSLAASMTSDNNRHLFFQDVNGSLRYIVFSQSLGAWSNNIYIIQTPQQPKLHTPLSVFRMSWTVFIVSFADIDNNLVAFTYCAYPATCLSAPNLFNSSYPMLPSSRSLNIVPLQSHLDQVPTNSSGYNRTYLLDDLLLFYSSPSNSVTVLHGSFVHLGVSVNGSLDETWIWRNVTDLIYPRGPDNSPLNSPLFSAAEINGGFNFFSLSAQLALGASSYSLMESFATNISSSADGTTLQFTIYDGPIRNLTASSPLPSAPQVAPFMQSLGSFINGTSDLLILPDAGFDSAGDSGIPCVVNEGMLNMSGLVLPNTHLPFGRLASLLSNTSVFIYHQLNESVLVEEVQDISLGTDGFGKPNQIIIPTQ